MITGTFKLYQGEELVGEGHNLITDEGKRAILRYLAGQIPGLVTDIGVGVGTSTPLGTDTDLHFEMEKVPVDFGSVNYTTNQITFKGTIPQGSVGTISEIGLWYSATDGDEDFLTSFDSESEVWDVGSFVTTNARIGIDALRLSPGASATLTSRLTDVALDLSDYKFSDPIRMAFNRSGNTTSIVLRLMTDASNYFSITVSSIAGYNVATFTKSGFTATGAPSWDNITMIEVAATGGTGGGTVDFDGVRIRSDFAPEGDVLISRGLLGAPIVKTDVSAMDIEYTLGVAL